MVARSCSPSTITFHEAAAFYLNDGTVKFIRTEEELKQLRWQ